MKKSRSALLVLIITILALGIGPTRSGLATAGIQVPDHYVYLPLNLKAPLPGVQMLPNYSYYVDGIDYLHVVGEVLNNTADHLQFVRITGNFFDGSGQLVDTDFTYTWLDNLPAFDRTCFELSLPIPAGWTYFEFEAPTFRTDGEPLPDLTVYNDSGLYLATFGWYRIIGQVRNDHGSRVKFVSPVATLYSASGIVIDCDFTYVSSTDLDPDQTSSFEIIASGRDYTDVSSYRLQVDGNPE